MFLRHLAPLAVAAALNVVPVTGAAESRYGYDWDALGQEFCHLTLAGDTSAMAPVLTDSLVDLIRRASGNPEMPSGRTLFQTYQNEVSECTAKTLSSAIVEIKRKNFGAIGEPAWTEYLVVVPQADGTTRIDDVLFATRRSDTLRARLNAWAAR